MIVHGVCIGKDWLHFRNNKYTVYKAQLPDIDIQAMTLSVNLLLSTRTIGFCARHTSYGEHRTSPSAPYQYQGGALQVAPCSTSGGASPLDTIRFSTIHIVITFTLTILTSCLPRIFPLGIFSLIARGCSSKQPQTISKRGKNCKFRNRR